MGEFQYNKDKPIAGILLQQSFSNLFLVYDSLMNLDALNVGSHVSHSDTCSQTAPSAFCFLHLVFWLSVVQSVSHFEIRQKCTLSDFMELIILSMCFILSIDY